jgi:hypothetical protein
MASLIPSFYSRSTWHAVGICLLPIAADQLVRRVFAKKLSAFKLEAAASIASAAILFLCLQLPPPFKLGAPLLYYAYRAAHYYLSRKAPPPARTSPFSAGLSANTKIVWQPSATTSLVTDSATRVTEQKNDPSEPNQATQPDQQNTDQPQPQFTENESPETTRGSAKFSTAASVAGSVAATSSQASTPPTKISEQKAVAALLSVDGEAERQAVLKFIKIIEPFEQSQIMSLNVQLKPMNTPVQGQKKLKSKTIKAQIRFGNTVVFKMDKKRIESFNKIGYTVNKETLFFWMDITDKTERCPSNFIPLKMLDNLKSDTKEFSLCLKEKDYQWTLPFKDKQLDRLKKFAETIRKCNNVEVIRNGIVKPSDETAALKYENFGIVLDNDLAAFNRLKCYIAPFKNS